MTSLLSPLFTQNSTIILASASPRRKQLLEEIGLKFTCMPADIDESMEPDEGPEQYVVRMAREKGKAVSSGPGLSCIISADTIVTQNGTVYGKPESPADALAILQSLNNATHQVITAVYIQLPDSSTTQFAAQTVVRFGHFSQSVLEKYIATGDPMDKAGAYGIQSIGSFLVTELQGSYTNVVGLPITQLIHRLIQCDILRA